ncbi:hypothetical protein [Sphingobacterium sp.]|jgi:hypothetical protein|uniref:hypothetical protein n=1 Tax=Sphingobacterium sp. TaxID=341027 RepID=UPI00289D759B|nr:hypothetical protein [Sphingobacterium sp.]
MGLFSNNSRGKGSHPFFHKATRSIKNTTEQSNQDNTPRMIRPVLFVKQYDILSIFKEILMPQNQN